MVEPTNYMPLEHENLKQGKKMRKALKNCCAWIPFPLSDPLRDRDREYFRAGLVDGLAGGNANLF